MHPFSNNHNNSGVAQSHQVSHCTLQNTQPKVLLGAQGQISLDSAQYPDIVGYGGDVIEYAQETQAPLEVATGSGAQMLHQDGIRDLHWDTAQSRDAGKCKNFCTPDQRRCPCELCKFFTTDVDYLPPPMPMEGVLYGNIEQSGTANSKASTMNLTDSWGLAPSKHLEAQGSATTNSASFWVQSAYDPGWMKSKDTTDSGYLSSFPEIAAVPTKSGLGATLTLQTEPNSHQSDITNSAASTASHSSRLAMAQSSRSSRSPRSQGKRLGASTAPVHHHGITKSRRNSSAATTILPRIAQIPHISAPESMKLEPIPIRRVTPPAPSLLGSKPQLNMYKCNRAGCGLSFKTKFNLDRHERTKHERTRRHNGEEAIITYSCPVDNCGRKGENGFTRKDNMMQHQRMVHNTELEPRVVRLR